MNTHHYVFCRVAPPVYWNSVVTKAASIIFTTSRLTRNLFLYKKSQSSDISTFQYYKLGNGFQSSKNKKKKKNEKNALKNYNFIYNNGYFFNNIH